VSAWTSKLTCSLVKRLFAASIRDDATLDVELCGGVALRAGVLESKDGRERQR